MADDLKKELEKQQELMRTKDIYIKRLNAEIQEVKNELKRAEDKLKKQTDKSLGEFMKALAEIFTRVDAGYVDFKDDMSDSRQMSYTLSKFKTTLQLQNIEVMVPNVLENYDIDEMEVTDVIPTANISEEELLKVAYSLEAKSEHPISKAIVEYANERNVALVET